MAKSYSIEWTQIALQDLSEIVQFLALREGFEFSEKTALAIIKKINSLSRYPKRCRLVPELREMGLMNYREIIHGPYRIFFRLAARQVILVGILDGRRDLEEILLARALFI